MKHELTQYQPFIHQALTTAIKQANLAQAGTWGEHATQRLTQFVTKGKGVRASLLLKSYHFFKEDLPEHVLSTAAGLELIHAGLLVHDDIMDGDDTRRGLAAAHRHYAQLAVDHHNPKHAGESIAICEADIAYFLGAQRIDARVQQRLLRDIALVGVAQMHDITNEHNTTTQQEILQCYEYKTSRYTFSIPLWAGAVFAGQHAIADTLYDLGVHAGIMYQLRDDELGLYGKPEITGKPIGSDIRQGKQTIYTALLKEHAGEQEYEQAIRILTTQDSEEHEIQWVCELINDSGARNAAKALSEIHAEKARTQLQTLALPEEHKEFLTSMLLYCTQRQK